LIYLRARYYSVEKGHFLQRDTWRGNLITPLSLNPWLYVLGNPVNFIDPSGLCLDEDLDGICDDNPYFFEEEYGIHFDKGIGYDWENNPSESFAVKRAVSRVAEVLKPFSRLSPGLTFRKVFGGIDFVLENLGSDWGWTSGPHKIKIQPGKVVNDPCNHVLIDFEIDPLARLVVHEIGHAFSGRLDEQYKKYRAANPQLNLSPNYGNNPEYLLQHEGIYDYFDKNHSFVTGYDSSLGRYNRSAGINPIEDSENYPYLGATYYEYQWIDGIKYKVYKGYQWHSEIMNDIGNSASEDWADIFMNWTYGSFNFSNTKGLTLFFWTHAHMQEWVDVAMGRFDRYNPQ
jgi:hypothetical protein